jgi:hypothetical protein
MRAPITQLGIVMVLGIVALPTLAVEQFSIGSSNALRCVIEVISEVVAD